MRVNGDAKTYMSSLVLSSEFKSGIFSAHKRRSRPRLPNKDSGSFSAKMMLKIKNDAEK